MADNYDRNRDNDRSDNRAPRDGRGFRSDRTNDRGDSSRSTDSGQSRDRGGYREGSSDRSRDVRAGGQGRSDNRNSDGIRSDRSGGDRREGGVNRDRPREDRRDDRRGGERSFNRDDRSGSGRSFSRDDRPDERRGGDRPYGRDDRQSGQGGQGQSRGGHSERRYEKRDDRSGRPGGRDGGRDAGQNRGHANRGGRDQQTRDNLHPQRSGFREERINSRLNEPDLPGDLDIQDLDPLVLQDLRVLSRDNADSVAKHMIMAATWLPDDPKLALRHARVAKERAGRVSVVRETCGIAAYHAGEWKEALSELRAARRMSGGAGLIAVMADCERGLGRPEKAIDLARTEDLSDLDEDSKTELAIVVAGARHDLGQHDSAVVELQRVNPSLTSTGLTAARLSYSYADALVLAGRADEAREWFQHVVDIDEDGFLDAAERIAQLPKGTN